VDLPSVPSKPSLLRVVEESRSCELSLLRSDAANVNVKGEERSMAAGLT
jgi:hypothetical protein